MPSLLDPGQIIKAVYAESDNRLRVDAEVTVVSPGEQEVSVSAVDDSIRLGDGSNLSTLTPIDGKVGLDVNILNDLGITPNGLSQGIVTTAVIVTDVSTQLPPVAFANRNGLSVKIMGTSTVYIGNSGVTTANGYPKVQGEEVTLDIRNSSAVSLYAVCESGETCEVRIIEVG